MSSRQATSGAISTSTRFLENRRDTLKLNEVSVRAFALSVENALSHSHVIAVRLSRAWKTVNRCPYSYPGSSSRQMPRVEDRNSTSPGSRVSKSTVVRDSGPASAYPRIRSVPRINHEPRDSLLSLIHI